MADDQSDLRVFYICGLGSNTTGAKPTYLRQHFRHLCIPSVKHASYAATRDALAKECRSFKPDIVVAHSAGVGKAVTLATTGTYSGPLLLLAGGNGCAPVSDMTGRAVTLVVPSDDAGAEHQRRAVRCSLDKTMVQTEEVKDAHDLNTSMVERHQLRRIIEETVQRHAGAGATTAPPEAAETGTVAESTAVIETPVKEQVKWLFSEWDRNDDGLVSREEFMDCLTKLCGEMSSDDVEQVVKAVDKNKDGQVDTEEFLDWVFSGAQHSDKVLAETSDPAAESHVAPVEPGDSAEEPPAELPAEPISVPEAPALEAVEPSTAEVAAVPAVPETPLPPEADVSLEPKEAEADPGDLLAHLVGLGGGQLYTWGRGTDGQLGQDKVRFPSVNCALPQPVPGLRRVVHVACGGGQQGCTGAVTLSGELYTFGNNFNKRLGHGDGPNLAAPKRVDALAGEHVIMSAFSADHGAALLKDGRVFLWGSNRYGQLGRGHCDKASGGVPTAVVLPGASTFIDCEDGYSAAVLDDGKLFTWGCNGHGRLGQGVSAEHVSTPGLACDGVRSVSLGSLYAGAVTKAGGLLMWGYGGHGNLGLGDRRSHSSPQAVNDLEPIRQLACTRGQEGCKGGLNPKDGGQEGPHTVAIAVSGAVYTMGTCHKGLLGNLGAKDGAFGRPWDEFKSYRLGGPLRNASEPPMSPLGLPPPYDAIGPAIQAVSAHIHCAVLCADGKAWAWGCGSNDGRCGVERFLNKKGEGKPPEVDMMKCYMMGPHRIGVARPLYWKQPSLQGQQVLMLSTGRNHMAAIALPAGE